MTYHNHGATYNIPNVKFALPFGVILNYSLSLILPVHIIRKSVNPYIQSIHKIQKSVNFAQALMSLLQNPNQSLLPL